jgi:hypothetical protein
VLSEDLFGLEPPAILETRVVTTIVGGEVQSGLLRPHPPSNYGATPHGSWGSGRGHVRCRRPSIIGSEPSEAARNPMLKRTMTVIAHPRDSRRRESVKDGCP